MILSSRAIMMNQCLSYCLIGFRAASVHLILTGQPNRCQHPVSVYVVDLRNPLHISQIDIEIDLE